MASRNATRHLYLATFAPDIFINTHQRPQRSLQATQSKHTSRYQFTTLDTAHI
jgi:hypothetical protein